MCAAGNPAWEKVAATVVARNNDLRAKLGKKPRKDTTPNWQTLIEVVREENEELEAKIGRGVKAPAFKKAAKKAVKKVVEETELEKGVKRAKQQKETGKKEK